MAIDWSHLPKDVKEKVCLRSTPACTARHKGYGLDPATGWWVCSGCGKPEVQTAVKECDICDKVFVPKYHDKVLLDFMGIMCGACDGTGID